METAEDLLNHVLVPKHEILSEEEVESLLKEFGIKKEQFPLIKLNDPVVVALDTEEGQVLRITRKSITAGESVYYRRVAR
ncbi:MAG: DNA-directed RNA polymerase subunit H [Candidatus Diapherotrites archaeon]|nr:DNA-directed RNA polymerase subunit H [Candidatus Diapherotrites archaeon]